MDTLQYITAQIADNGWCVIDDALPESLCKALQQQVVTMPKHAFKGMGVGRGKQLHIDKSYRSDTSHWMVGNTQAEQHYFTWMQELRLAVNQHLFLGLLDYEAHFAHYAPQSFYKRHLDAFHAETNMGVSHRKLTTVYYLNADWTEKDGGKLLIYQDANSESVLQKVSPRLNRLVVFLSDAFPHEVLPAKRNRYSIAGWFRVKT